jgi:hypothetical protein
MKDTKRTKDAKAKSCWALIVCVAALAIVEASDRVGVYGVIDSVIFEPNADSPERVQLWGAFAVAKKNDRNLYEPVQTGYLYFQLPSEQRLARAEWNDLKSLAGAKRIVAFSARFGQSVRLRTAAEKPQAPDTYTLGVGVHPMRPDIDHAPIKALSLHINR